MSRADSPKIMYEDAAQLIVSWHNVVVSVLGHSPLTQVGVRAQVAITAACGRENGEQRLVEIVLIDSNAPVPSADVRAVLDAGVGTVGPYYLAVASVFEGTGFRAAVVRGVLTSLSLLSRTEFSQRVFASVSTCTAWCSPFLERTRTPNAGELANVIAEVRGAAIARRILSPDRPSARDERGPPHGAA